jgi:predicted transcriptional regulator
MLIVETIARIRREYFIKGKTIKEIARDLKVSRNTVRKVLRSGETSFECRAKSGVAWVGWAMSIPHRSHIGANSSGTRFWFLI